MPFPDVAPSSEPGLIGRCVFISYAHKDLNAATAFFESLCTLALANTDLGLHRDRIFFDRKNLKAGDDWSGSIETDLRRADLFILLVSTQSLLSKYCFEKEVALAAGLRIPIIPVLLQPTPQWESMQVKGGLETRKLGAFNAVPINGRHGPDPIASGHWESQVQGRTAAVEQIAERLARDTATAAARCMEAKPPPGRRTPPFRLLPAFCNQIPTENSFLDGLDLWADDRALVVLIKGVFDDDAPACWDRLRDDKLAEYCEEKGLGFSSKRPLTLPRAADVGATAAQLTLALRRNLSSALVGNSRRFADIASVLESQAGMVVLCATLPEQPQEDAAQVLAALLRVLDELPAAAPAKRLAIAVVVESPALVSNDRLIEAFGLPARSARCHLVETRALQPLIRDDVRLWYREYELKDRLQVDEAKLLNGLFGEADKLRHRLFDQHVKTLLKPDRDQTP